MPRLHVISFQNPYPPNYGGVIDVYYKLKALKEAGYDITLHTFAYRERSHVEEELKDVVSEIIVYERNIDVLRQMSLKPFIVNSRNNRALLANLIKDNAPILFEGLHTCAFLDSPLLTNRLKIVRAHNVEHHYYSGLAKASKGIAKKLYFYLESFRLKRYEKVLRNADYICAISQPDLDYFRSKYGDKSVLLPCFFDDAKRDKDLPFEDYVLYQGNLSVEENIKAVEWIIDNVSTMMPSTNFVFAGLNPPEHLVEKIGKERNATLKTNLSAEEMDSLISRTKVSLLITFQPTGVKLKLLNALGKSGSIVANSMMVSGSGVEEYCLVADEPEQIRELILQQIANDSLQQNNFAVNFNNKVNGERLIKILEKNRGKHEPD